MGQRASHCQPEQHHDPAQAHWGQQVQLDQTRRPTPTALPSPHQQAWRWRQQNPSATTDTWLGAQNWQRPWLVQLCPWGILFYVLCKTASCQCLVTVSTGWQFCLYSYHRRLLFQGRGSEPPRHTNSCFCSSGPLCVCSNA